MSYRTSSANGFRIFYILKRLCIWLAESKPHLFLLWDLDGQFYRIVKLTWTFWNPFSHSSIFSKRQSFLCFYLIILFIDYRLLHICLTVIHCNKKSTDILLVLFSVVLWSEFLRSFKLIRVLMCVKCRIKGPLFWQSRAGSNLKTENCLKACIWEKKGSYHAWRVIWIHCRIAKKLVFNKRWIMAWHISYFNILMQIISKSFQSRYNF